MPIISNNFAANASLLYLNQNSSTESSDLQKLASGSNIVQASDDPAGLGIGTQLEADVTVLSQDATNTSQGASILQVADGGLSTISDILEEMESLATESASGNVSDTQRTQDINTEFQQLVDQIGTVISSTTYGSQSLLDGSFSGINFLVGTLSSDLITVTISGVSLSGIGLTSVDVTTQSGALAAVTQITSAINLVTQYRASVGAYEERFNFSSETVNTTQLNTQNAESTVMDADEAEEKSNLSSADVLSQAAIAALAQAADMPKELLTLIQS
jgi:flagellin